MASLWLRLSTYLLADRCGRLGPRRRLVRYGRYIRWALIPTALCADFSCPVPGCNGPYGVGPPDERIPRVAAGIGDGAAGVKHAVGEMVLADLLPDAPDRDRSGEYGGKGSRLMLSGTTRPPPGRCQPAPPGVMTACAPGAIWELISARCRFIAAMLTPGRTRAAPTPRAGQTAPNSKAEVVR